MCIETDKVHGGNGNGPHAKQRTTNPCGHTSVFKWVTGIFSLVIHMFDIGRTGVSDADMKNDS